MGLSPRVRGSQYLAFNGDASVGSIPAGAGEPVWFFLGFARSRVYPRGCGGAHGITGALVAARGLSPRVRGSLSRSRAFAHLRGSIPAGAGEPLLGLSTGLGQGSIPAGAGEPSFAAARAARSRVYPRGCGGAALAAGAGTALWGLSPRVRGSLSLTHKIRIDLGSIPAGAGEPRSSAASAPPRGVYPRGCGGARPGRTGLGNTAGLSPRVRGSLPSRCADPSPPGSIPAGAGEPSRRARPTSCWRVYPRGCGGASWRTLPGTACGGLSPRVRGSPGYRAGQN